MVSTRIAVRQDRDCVILHRIEVLEDFSVTARIKNRWEVGIGDEHFEHDERAEGVKRNQNLGQRLARVSNLEAQVADERRPQLLTERALVGHVWLCH